jgi:hypothetical protein
MPVLGACPGAAASEAIRDEFCIRPIHGTQLKVWSVQRAYALTDTLTAIEINSARAYGNVAPCLGAWAQIGASVIRLLSEHSVGRGLSALRRLLKGLG